MVAVDQVRSPHLYVMCVYIHTHYILLLLLVWTCEFLLNVTFRRKRRKIGKGKFIGIKLW